MGRARRDDNFVPTLTGVSSSDGETPIEIYADASTNRLFTNALISDGTNTAKITSDGQLEVSDTAAQMSAFGERSVAEPTPIVQVQFPYNINTDIWEVRDNNGTSSVLNDKANLSTGASANQTSSILTRNFLKYNAGQGALVRFTAVFTTGVANSTQYIGVGGTDDGYFFGYNGATFGILRRQGGRPETRRLEITTKSTNADSITITLDGDTKAVTVTDATATDVTTTANEIAATDFSNVGKGWEAHSMGEFVFFTSYTDSAKSGTYSLTDATSAAGTFSQSLAGVTTTETIVTQVNWSEDTLDGSSDANNPSGITLDTTKGNVYQIQYQWLGFGAISFFVEHGEEGVLHLVHIIKYANTATIPSVDNPTLPLYAAAINTSNTSDIVLQIGSMGGFVEGRNVLDGLPHSLSVEKTGIGTTETPVMTIHSHDLYQGVLNRVKIKMTHVSISVEGTKPVTIRLRKNTTLTAASFSALDSNTSTIHKDTTASAVSGGTIVYAQSIEKIGHAGIDLEAIGIEITAPGFLTLTIEASAGSVDTVSTLNWQELF